MLDAAGPGFGHAELMAWRKRQRIELVARRMAVAPRQLDLWRQAIDRHLQFGFPGLGRGVIAFCWPIRNEYDPRHLLRRLRDEGACCALPVVVAPRTPLVFRPWRPGVPMAIGALDIPYPSGGDELVPDTVLLPMNGFDRQGFRLGYGGGFFDRTLEQLGRRARRPRVIGVTFEIAAIATIQPQPWDIAVDHVVTERGLYRRDGEAADATLEFLGVPEFQGVELSSPVCYLPADTPVD
jgi:5-formyltetrahydrofolate cyclo-ligase